MVQSSLPTKQPESASRTWGGGSYGPFQILSYLDEEDREIDIDDRAAVLIAEIRLLESEAPNLVAENVVVTLDFDFSEQKNILLADLQKGPLVLAGGSGQEPLTIGPRQPLKRYITIRTGLFSDKRMQKNTPAAVSGEYPVKVSIRYNLVSDGQHRKSKATMQFSVAED